MRWEFRFTGIGGQGAITVGNVLGRAAVIYGGKEAVVTEGYSPYVTGGWSRADVIVSNKPIDYPLVTKLDVLLTMYQEGLDLNLKMMKMGGTVIAESRLVNLGNARKDLRAIAVPGIATAESLGKKIIANVVMLGAVPAVCEAVSLEDVKRATADRFAKSAELNMKALDRGFEIGSTLRQPYGQQQEQISR
ncbi:MAG: 2-oxoacid:acceptor oxidoreductase family protein [Nitrososphaerota archaeon]|nr:2-oxoacid:acceptor oxidoreductase family protein [Nitrososphaerota archaeon]